MINRSRRYQMAGKFLMASAIVFGVVLGLQIMAEGLHTQVVQSAEYLVIANTPEIGLPLITPTPLPTATLLPTTLPSPTPTPTLTPTPTREPEAPIRVQIPKVKIN